MIEKIQLRNIKFLPREDVESSVLTLEDASLRVPSVPHVRDGGHELNVVARAVGAACATGSEGNHR